MSLFTILMVAMAATLATTEFQMTLNPPNPVEGEKLSIKCGECQMKTIPVTVRLSRTCAADNKTDCDFDMSALTRNTSSAAQGKTAYILPMYKNSSGTDIQFSHSFDYYSYNNLTLRGQIDVDKVNCSDTRTYRCSCTEMRVVAHEVVLSKQECEKTKKIGNTTPVPQGSEFKMTLDPPIPVGGKKLSIKCGECQMKTIPVIVRLSRTCDADKKADCDVDMRVLIRNTSLPAQAFIHLVMYKNSSGSEIQFSQSFDYSSPTNLTLRGQIDVDKVDCSDPRTYRCSCTNGEDVAHEVILSKQECQSSSPLMKTISFWCIVNSLLVYGILYFSE